MTSSNAPESAVLKVGDVLAGAHRVERPLGGGGIGEVYLARDLHLDRPVAIKVLRENLASDAKHVARFEREALAMSRVVHPNVVGIYGFGTHLGHSYLVLEYVEGESLQDHLTREGRLPVAEAVSVVVQIAQGLAEAHAVGVVHRDVKPGNIVLRQLASGPRVAKVVDFGLARQFSAGPDPTVTKPHDVIGTPHYMSPEQVNAQALDGRSDIYSLGVVLYEALTGSVPFPKASVLQAMIAHVTDEVPEPQTFCDQATEWPPGLWAALQRALAKDPTERFVDILSFAAALERVVAPAESTSSIGEVCIACRAAVLDGQRFCPQCGAGMPTARCPGCGAPNEGERYRCVVCWGSLLPSSQLATLNSDANRALRRTTAVALVATVDADVDAEPFTQMFINAVERESGRAIVVADTEAIALFGVGGMGARDGESALDAALILEQAMRASGPELNASPVNIGVELGPVTARGPGVAFGAAVIGGETISRARAASEQLADGGICVGPRIYREVCGAYVTRAVDGEHRQILRRKPIQLGLADLIAQGESGPLVGRELELETIVRATRRAADSLSLAVVPIIGAAGVGKSRLVVEALRRVEDHDSSAWYIDAVRCSPSKVTISYEPFSQMLQARLRIHEASSTEALRGKVEAILSTDRSQQRRRQATALLRLLGLDMDSHPQSGAAPLPGGEAEQLAAYDAFAAYLRAATTESPAILVLEDLQWAKGPTLSLLKHLIRECLDIPLVLLLVVRDERANEVLKRLELPPTVSQPVVVEPLDLAQTAALVEGLLVGREASPALVSEVHQFSSGVPLLVETAVATLAAEATTEADPDAAPPPLKRSLAELVVDRVWRLAPGERRLAEALAACGHTAPRPLLSAMLERPIAEHDFVSLRNAGILRESRRRGFDGVREFSFRQPHLRELVLEGVSEAQRRLLHARAARWMLENGGRRPPGFTATLTEHLLGAGDLPRAAKSLVEVATEATRGFANEAAFDSYQRALEVSREWSASAPDDPEATATRVQAAIGSATLGLQIGRHDEALAAALEALETATEQGADGLPTRIRALCLRGDVLAALGQMEKAVEAFDAAVSHGEGGGHSTRGIVTYAAGRQAMTLLKNGEKDRAEVYATEALERATDDIDDVDYHRGLGSLHGTLGHLASRRGDFDTASACYATARRERLLADDGAGAAMALLGIGNAAYLSNDLELAEEAYGDALADCLEIGFVRGEAFARTNLGAVLLDTGRPAQALEELRAAGVLFRKLDAKRDLPETLWLTARSAAELGEGEAAVAAADEAIDLARELDDSVMVATISDWRNERFGTGE